MVISRDAAKKERDSAQTILEKGVNGPHNVIVVVLFACDESPISYISQYKKCNIMHTQRRADDFSNQIVWEN